MIKTLIALAALVLTSPAPAHADPFLVVPGRSLGRTHLGAGGTADLKRLPRPDGNDAAMGGRRYMAWKSQTSRDTLAVFAVDLGYMNPPQSGFNVEDIRATSPKFHTANGAASGETLAEIKRLYPAGHLEMANDQTSSFYSVKQGIAFEFRPHPPPSARCLSVAVFLTVKSDIGSAELITTQAARDLLEVGAH